MIRTQTAIALVSALMLVLAGCAGGVSPAPNGGVDTTAANDADVGAGTDGGDGGDGTATGKSSAISFYLSDKPSAIDDFEHLNVTITTVGFHRVESAETDATTTANGTTTTETTNETPTEPTATDQPTATATGTATATATVTAEPEDGGEGDDREHENETEQEQDRDDDEQEREEEQEQDREQDGDGEWVTTDVNDTTVDLTELQGANATKLDVLEVVPGTYDKVFIYVGEIEATLQNGEQVRVKLPSERLHVNNRFTVGNNDSVDFVFDISVFKAGKSGKYILKPVVSQTGTGDEVEIDPVDDDDEDEETKGGDGEKNPEGENADDMDENEAGEGNETAGDDGNGTETETAVGELTADLRGPVKSGATVTLAVTRNGDPVANATVEVNGERVGTTDADGTIEVEIPQDAEELEISVTKGEAEIEIERTIRGSGGNGGN
jgi:hypothetical protein